MLFYFLRLEEGIFLNASASDEQWRDLLTAYDGHAITYDQTGNPLTYYDGSAFTWQNGRQLASWTKSGQTTSYTYNADGLRTKKVNPDGSWSEYHWIGSTLISENRFRANGERHWTLQFQYDQNGSPVGVSFRDCGESTFTYVYYYAKNLQGDIVGLYKRNPDGTGAQAIATYEYDPWGKVTAVRDANGALVTYPSGSNLIAFMNPLRYRGYYQDNDTGFYYLQSRYYDPELKRFINADSYSSTGQGFLGHNMFAYCNNNPVNTSDPTGELGIVGIGALIGGAAGGLSSLVGAVCTGGFKALKQKDTWINAGKSALVGIAVGAVSAFIGAVGGGTLSLGAQVLVRMGSSFVGDLLTTRWVNGTLTARDYVMAGLDMVMDGCFSGLSYFYNPWEGFTGDVSNMVIDGAVDVGESALTSGSTANASQSSQMRPSSGYTPKYKPIRCGHYVSALD